MDINSQCVRSEDNLEQMQAQCCVHPTIYKVPPSTFPITEEVLNFIHYRNFIIGIQIAKKIKVEINPNDCFERVAGIGVWVGMNKYFWMC